MRLDVLSDFLFFNVVKLAIIVIDWWLTKFMDSLKKYTVGGSV